jgi:hypothetical protein
MTEDGGDNPGVPVSAAQAIANAALAEAISTQRKEKHRAVRAIANHSSVSTAGDDEKEASLATRVNNNKDESEPTRRQGSFHQKRVRSETDDDISGTIENDDFERPPREKKTSKTSLNHQVNMDTEGESPRQRLKNSWHFAQDSEWTDQDRLFQNALETTSMLTHEQIDSLVQDGVQAHQKVELLKEMIESKDVELQRLRETVTSHRSTIQNLLKNAEQAKSDAKDASRGALVEAQLRSEFHIMVTQKDKAIEAANESQHKYELLELELQQTKAKMTKVENDNVKLRRDRNATMSWARSVDNHISADSDFYKRKVKSVVCCLLVICCVCVTSTELAVSLSFDSSRLASNLVVGHGANHSHPGAQCRPC